MRTTPLLAIILATGCVTDTHQPDAQSWITVGDLDDHEPATLYIYGGSAPDAPEHAATVALHQRSGDRVGASPFCSGTLIAPDVVLTAAHCLDVTRGGKPRFTTMSPDSLAIYVGDDPSIDLVAHVYPVVETLIHPGYDRNRLLNDIALVRLAYDATEAAPVPPLPPSEGLTDGDDGGLVNFAGFGEAEDGSFGVKLQVDGTIGGLGCAVGGCPDAGDRDTMVSYAQPDAGPCFGDSGGPMFISRASGVYVAGITSYGDSYCRIYGVSTRVDAYDAFIADFVSGGGDPGDGGGGDPGDGGGGDPGTCGNDVCDEGESCDGRDGTADCPSDCAGRTSGRPTERFCWVGATCEGPGC